MPEIPVIIEGSVIAGIMPFALAFMLFVCMTALLVYYFVPSIIALLRCHPQKVAVLILNLFLGWTFVGWVISLVWAVMKQDKN